MGLRAVGGAAAAFGGFIASGRARRPGRVGGCEGLAAAAGFSTVQLSPNLYGKKDL